MTGESRDEVLESTRQQGGRCQAVKGPFGTELRRALPVKDPNGNPAMHLSQELQVLGEIIWELDLPQCRQEPAMRFRKAPHTHEAEDGYSG